MSCSILFTIPHLLTDYSSCDKLVNQLTSVTVILSLCFFVCSSHLYKIILGIASNRKYLYLQGITNHDEYSLVHEIVEEKKEEMTGTLKKDKTLLRDDKKMEKLKQKLHTDDDCKCYLFVERFNTIHFFVIKI